MRIEPLEARLNLAADWLLSFGDVGKDEADAGVEVDHEDNVFVAGDFEGTIDLAPSAEIPGDTLTSQGDRDAYLAKFDSSGALQWARSFGGSATDFAWGVAVDSQGNSFISGGFYGTADLDPGVATALHTSAGGADAFVAKLNPNGNLLWVQTAAGDRWDGFVSVHTDSAGDVYLETDSESLQTTHGNESFSGNGANFRLISKLDGTNGDFEWVRQFVTDEPIGGAAIAVNDSGGTISVAGDFSGTLDVGSGFTFSSSPGDRDVFLAILDASDGATTIATSFSGAGRQRNWANAFDSQGNVLLTGQFEGVIDFDPAAQQPDDSNIRTATPSPDGVARSDVYVVKLDANLNFLAAYTFGGPGYQTPWATNTLVLSPDGRQIVVGGQFEGVADFGAGVLVSSGQMDGFIVSLDANLNPLWAERLGGSGASGSGFDDSDNFTALSLIRDDTSDDGVSGVAFDSTGNLLVTGDFKQTASFPTGGQLDSQGDTDVFLMKLDLSQPRISGNVFADFDADGFRKGDTLRDDRFREGILESQLWTVYLDANGNGLLDAGERTAIPQGNSGNFSFGAVDPGTTIVRQVVPEGWTETTPGNGHQVELAVGDDPLRVDFGNTIATQQPQTYDSGNINQRIRNRRTITSQLDVPDQLTVFDVDVELDITHANVADLEAVLIAPDGTPVELFARVGGSGDNFAGTVLDDDVAASITSASAPFSGSFQPAGNLSTLAGKQSKGTWRLQITDTANRNEGRLNSWSLSVFGTDAINAPNAPPTIDSLVGSPNPVVVGEDLTLTAGGVADDTGVAQVEFYRDEDGNGQLDESDALVGVDSDSGGGWSVTSPASQPLGTQTFFAVTTDDAGLTSEVVLTTVEVVEQPSGSATDIYVADIDFQFRNRGKNVDGRIIIDILNDVNANGVDPLDIAAQNVLVTVTLTDPAGTVTQYGGLTDSSGIFRSGWIRSLSAGDYVVNVIDLAHASLEWNMVLDVEDDSDSIVGPDDVFTLV